MPSGRPRSSCSRQPPLEFRQQRIQRRNRHPCPLDWSAPPAWCASKSRRTRRRKKAKAGGGLRQSAAELVQALRYATLTATLALTRATLSSTPPIDCLRHHRCPHLRTPRQALRSSVQGGLGMVGGRRPLRLHLDAGVGHRYLLERDRIDRPMYLHRSI